MIIRALLLAGLAAVGFFVFLRRNKLPFHIVIMFLMLGGGAAAVLAPEETLDSVAHPDADIHGKTLEASRRPVRVRKSQKSKSEYDF